MDFRLSPLPKLFGLLDHNATTPLQLRIVWKHVQCDHDAGRRACVLRTDAHLLSDQDESKGRGLRLSPRKEIADGCRVPNVATRFANPFGVQCLGDRPKVVASVAWICRTTGSTFIAKAYAAARLAPRPP